MNYKIVLSIIVALTSFYAVSASSTELSAMRTSSKMLLGEKKRSETNALSRTILTFFLILTLIAAKLKTEF